MGQPSPALNRDREGAASSTYLITFGAYGAWLPGQPGAVDRRHNRFGSRNPEPDAALEARAAHRMEQPAYFLDEARREAVLSALQEVCLFRGWILLGAHVRTTHVHVVVDADRCPEQVMTTFKAYASRALARKGLDIGERRRWARHGSTRYLWTSAAVSAAVHYVVCDQGEAMAVFTLATTR